MKDKYVQKSKDEWEQEKAQFMSLYLYIKQTDPEEYQDWFDKEAIDKYVKGKFNPYYNAQLKNKNKKRHSYTSRIPTRCPECRRAWAIEIGARNKFGPAFLDPEVYNNIPLVKGLCHECEGKNNG